MTEKPFWISRIEKAWEEASIVWLAGDDDSGEGIRKAGLNRGKGHGSRVRELLESCNRRPSCRQALVSGTEKDKAGSTPTRIFAQLLRKGRLPPKSDNVKISGSRIFCDLGARNTNLFQSQKWWCSAIRFYTPILWLTRDNGSIVDLVIENFSFNGG
jgi:hypothetical protein